jgi:hypothetical protein
MLYECILLMALPRRPPHRLELSSACERRRRGKDAGVHRRSPGVARSGLTRVTRTTFGGRTTTVTSTFHGLPTVATACPKLRKFRPSKIRLAWCDALAPCPHPGRARAANTTKPRAAIRHLLNAAPPAQGGSRSRSCPGVRRSGRALHVRSTPQVTSPAYPNC